MKRTRRSTAKALIVLGVAGVGAFALSTAAVSAAGPTVVSSSSASQYPFANLSLTGGVQAPNPSSKVYALDFATTFTLSPDSPGITAPIPEGVPADTTPRLADVTIENTVSYPVPSGDSAQAVGPVGLPFSTETLTLTVRLQGNCFVEQSSASGQVSYVLQGQPSDCAAATLTLEDKAYDVSSLFDSVGASFTQIGSQTWTGETSATFENPGYTFPVSSLGGNGGTTLRIGPNGGVAPTNTAAFGGGPDLVGPPTNQGQCKGAGWKTFNNPSFKTQGDCVSYVSTGGKNPGTG